MGSSHVSAGRSTVGRRVFTYWAVPCNDLSEVLVQIFRFVRVEGLSQLVIDVSVLLDSKISSLVSQMPTSGLSEGPFEKRRSRGQRLGVFGRSLEVRRFMDLGDKGMGRGESQKHSSADTGHRGGPSRCPGPNSYSFRGLGGRLGVVGHVPPGCLPSTSVLYDLRTPLELPARRGNDVSLFFYYY